MLKVFDNTVMLVQKNVPLQSLNSFHIAATAHSLARITSVEQAQALLRDPEWAGVSKRVLGGGSNLLLTADVTSLVLKVDIKGIRLVQATEDAFVVEAGAGELWHDLVAWTLAQGYGGLENLAMIPGTVGAAPVQNIGAYGLELHSRFLSLDAVDLPSGHLFSLTAEQCGFGYRDSVFKHGCHALIVRVRLRLPRPWTPVLGYADIRHQMTLHGCDRPDAKQMGDWVCDIRRAKLPDPDVTGNAGSFFKNPVVTSAQWAGLVAGHPRLVHYPQADGSIKLAAGWLIDTCGWRGQTLGAAGVHDQHALVLINRRHGHASGTDVLRLAHAIQASVQQRFGILLEIEPAVW